MENEIGVMVATVRALKNITQTQLAEDSTVDRAYISRLEGGKQSLSSEHIAKLESALGVSFDAIRPAFLQLAAAVLADGPALVTGGDGEAGDG